MKPVTSYSALNSFGRTRLSKYFFMRDFLYSEIGNFFGIPNLPEDQRLAIETGTRLATDLLDPLVETFGPISVRSSYRGLAVNGYGNEHDLSCASNEANFAGHIWDRLDKDGNRGATACISIPWFADQHEQGRDWRDLAWWIHDHLPYSSQYFYPVRASLNLNWCSQSKRTISSFINPKGKLLAAGSEPDESPDQRAARYADFPKFRGIAYPAIPNSWSKEKS